MMRQRPLNQDWGDHWSWSKMINVLSSTDAPEHLHIARQLWNLQARSFRQLRELIEDPTQSTGWELPFLLTRIYFPFKWGRKAPAEFASPQSRRKRNLFIALQALTAGASVQPENGDLSLTWPENVLKRLEGSTSEELRRCSDRWVAPETWCDFIDYGDKCMAEEKNPTLTGWAGQKRHFAASLWFCISPHVLDPTQRLSYFVLVFGLSTNQSHNSSSPGDWSPELRNALWETIEQFFGQLSRVRSLDVLPSKIIRNVQDYRHAEVRIDHFEASFGDQANSYLKKTKPRPLSKSALSKIPEYAVGTCGPTLNITDGSGELSQWAFFELLAVMAHPDNEQFRREYLSKVQADSISKIVSRTRETAATYNVPPKPTIDILVELNQKFGFFTEDILQALVTAPSFEDLRNRQRKSVYEGEVAASILIFLLRCAEHHPEHMSVNKAAFVKSKFRLGSKDRAGNSMDYGLSTIKKSWAKFRPVSHLWAAYGIWQQETGGAEDLWEFSGNGDKAIRFLATGEAIRRRGEALFARAQKIQHGPILDPSATWRPPEDLVIPHFEFDLDPLPQETLSLFTAVPLTQKTNPSCWS